MSFLIVLHQGLELGGKDPAYVASDADVAQAVDGLVDGAMYNAGQSCCSVERVYVHASRYDDFVQQSSDLIAQYVLGDPQAESTTMGPVAQKNQSQFILNQVQFDNLIITFLMPLFLLSFLLLFHRADFPVRLTRPREWVLWLLLSRCCFLPRVVLWHPLFSRIATIICQS